VTGARAAAAQLLERPNLHWRYRLMTMHCVAALVRADARPPHALLRAVCAAAVSDIAHLRKFSMQARPSLPVPVRGGPAPLRPARRALTAARRPRAPQLLNFVLEMLQTRRRSKEAGLGGPAGAANGSSGDGALCDKNWAHWNGAPPPAPHRARARSGVIDDVCVADVSAPPRPAPPRPATPRPRPRRDRRVGPGPPRERRAPADAGGAARSGRRWRC